MKVPLLGRSACLALDTIAKVGTLVHSEEDIKQRFLKVLSGPGCTEGEYAIILSALHKPFNQMTPRPVAISSVLLKVKDEINQMESMEVIEKVDASENVLLAHCCTKTKQKLFFFKLNKATLHRAKLCQQQSRLRGNWEIQK